LFGLSTFVLNLAEVLAIIGIVVQSRLIALSNHDAELVCQEDILLVASAAQSGRFRSIGLCHSGSADRDLSDSNVRRPHLCGDGGDGDKISDRSQRLRDRLSQSLWLPIEA
jgi:hypothetical protein